MKKLLTFAALICLFCFSQTMNAQLKFGIRGGANFANLDIDDIKTNSATGWFIGPTTEFLIPVIGLGLDASFLYSKISSEVSHNLYDKDYKLHYLTIPVNIKYKIFLPIVQPFIFAGPEVCVRIADNLSHIRRELADHDIPFPYKANGTDMKINVGGGVELFNRLEVFVNYNVGLTNTIKHIDSKTKLWRVGAVMYF